MKKIILCFVLIFASGLYVNKTLTLSAETKPKEAPSGGAQKPQQSGKEFILGNKNAPVKVVMYFEPICTHCADYEQNTLPKIEEEFIKTGKVCYIFRPLADFQKINLFAMKVMFFRGIDKAHMITKKIMGGQEEWLEPILNYNYKNKKSQEKMQAVFEEKAEEVANTLGITKAKLLTHIQPQANLANCFIKLFVLKHKIITPEELEKLSEEGTNEDIDFKTKTVINAELARKDFGKSEIGVPSFVVNGKPLTEQGKLVLQFDQLAEIVKKTT